MTKTAKTVILFINMRINVIRPGNQACLVFVLISTAVCLSCLPGKDETPVLPPLTSPLSRPHIGFGVINVSYTRVNAEPAEDSGSSGYLRRGSVVLIRERRQIISGGRTESWLLVEETSTGWIRESLVDVYENELKARTASQTMNR